MAVETSRAHFWHAAEGDLFAWMPASREDRAVAALSAVIYGDPALQAIRTTSSTDVPNKAVDQDTATVAVAEGAAGTSAAAESSSDGSVSLFTVGVIAAVAILAVIVTRRSPQ
jgi:hypothetical protein